MAEWSFHVEQGGMIVASGFAPDRDTAMREANHYAMMYSTDGRVKWSVNECHSSRSLPSAQREKNDG
jgi:hypothetical protein